MDVTEPLLPGLDAPVDEDIDGSPQDNVQDDGEGQGNDMDKQYVQQGQGEGAGDNRNHCMPLGHAQSQKFVVDMVLVRQEGGFAVAQAEQVDPHHIESRYHERAVREDAVVASLEDARGRKGEKLNAQEGQYQADSEASGVAHKNLAVPGGVAEDVVVKERDQHAESRERQEGEDGLAA